MARLISPGEEFRGDKVRLRLATVEDCTDDYVAWLNDPEVSRYLETRWQPQTKATIEAFVRAMASSADSYLFAIVAQSSGRHVGNIKIGPMHARHSHADVSYFIGDRRSWRQGLASDAIRVAARIAFERLELHRVQAGLYEGNVGSARALEKAGFCFEGRLRKQLRTDTGWEDHLYYGLLREEWRSAT